MPYKSKECGFTTYDADELQVGEDMTLDNNLLPALSFQQAKSFEINLQQEDLAGKAIEKALEVEYKPKIRKYVTYS